MFAFEFEVLLQATYVCMHPSRLYAMLCWFGPRVRFSIVDQTCDPPYTLSNLAGAEITQRFSQGTRVLVFEKAGFQIMLLSGAGLGHMSMWRHERHGVTYLLTQRRLAAKAILPITSLQVSLYPSGIIRPQIAGS